jgi:biopolymer transport protein ExbD
MKIKRLRQSKKGQIELIPMIDVMFFLLVTFMLASLSMQRLNAVKVNLTQGKADSIQVENKITLTVTSGGLFFLNKEQLELKALKLKLQTLLQEGDKTVIVLADKNALQGVVMQAMLAAQQAGAKHFSVITKD